MRSHLRSPVPENFSLSPSQDCQCCIFVLENRCNLVCVDVCVVYWVSDSVLVAAQPPPSPFSGGLHLSFPFFALPSSTPSGFAHIVNFFSFFSVDYFYFSNLWSCTATLPCALSFVSRRKRDQSGCISRKFSAIGAPCTETILQRSLSLFPSQGKGRSASLERDPFFYFFVACILKFQGPLIITTQYCYSSYSLATGIENVRWGSEKEANNMNSQERRGKPLMRHIHASGCWVLVHPPRPPQSA